MVGSARGINQPLNQELTPEMNTVPLAPKVTQTTPENRAKAGEDMLILDRRCLVGDSQPSPPGNAAIAGVPLQVRGVSSPFLPLF